MLKDRLSKIGRGSSESSDWALYAESTEVLDYVYTKTRTFKGETYSLKVQLKMKHADDQRSDDSEEPLPIFDSLSFSIQAF